MENEVKIKEKSDFLFDADKAAKKFHDDPEMMQKWQDDRSLTLSNLQKKHGEAMKKMGYGEGMSPQDLPDKRIAKHIGWMNTEDTKHTMPEMYEHYIEMKNKGFQNRPEFQTYASVFPEGEDKPRSENFNRWSGSGKTHRMLGDSSYLRKDNNGEYWYWQKEGESGGSEHPISERRASELFEGDYAERAKREESARQEEEAARKQFAKRKDFIDETEAMRMMGHGVDEDAELQIAGGATISAAPESGYILSYGEGKNLSMFDISEEQARDLIQANDGEIAEFIADMYDGAPTKERYASRNFEGGSERRSAERKPAPQPEQKPAEQPKPAPQPEPEQKPAENKPVDNKPSGENRRPSNMKERIFVNRALKSKTLDEAKKILKDAALDYLVPFLLTQFTTL